MAALPQPYCTLNSVTMHNTTNAAKLLDGGYLVPASGNLVIDFTLLSVYGKVRQAEACNNADAGGVLTITAHT